MDDLPADQTPLEKEYMSWNVSKKEVTRLKFRKTKKMENKEQSVRWFKYLT